MPTHVMTNPQSFVREAKKQNIVYEYLVEAFECIGQQEMCKMFVGRSTRGQDGTLSSGTLLNWKITFEFIKNNPTHVDTDKYQSRSIVKNGSSWDQYVELIKKPIPDDVVAMWSNLSKKKLGDEAIKHGITYGIRRKSATDKLLDRMKEMVKRRKETIWGKEEDLFKNSYQPEKEEELKLKNIFELRELCNQRGISHGGNRKKDDMIKDLLKPIKCIKKDSINYNEMTCPELKRLAKERQLLRYNNFNKTSLVELHQKYDEEIKKQNINETSNIPQIDTKEFLLVDASGNTHPIIIRKDGMANATLLTKAYNKAISEYLSNKDSKHYIEAVRQDLGYEDDSKLIEIKKGGDTKLAGTWVHHLIAIDIARWAYPPASVQMNKWITEYVSTGTIQPRRPCRLNFDLTEMDIEAEEFEQQYDWGKHCNACVLYVAYIGDGLVKVGSTDCKLLQREMKHSSSGSQFSQMRLVETFEISSICIEKTIHQLLQRFRVVFNKQKEIYKPPNTIKNFLNYLNDLLKEHDLKMEVQRLQKKITELQLENYELRLKTMTKE